MRRLAISILAALPTMAGAAPIIATKAYVDSGIATRVKNAEFDSFKNREEGFATAEQGAKADSAIATKQDMITATGATNLLTAPALAGGQPGTKPISYFAPSLYYSENEQLTGAHWIDGKPIYQRTVTYKMPTNMGTYEEAIIATGVSTMIDDSMILIRTDGFIYRGNLVIVFDSAFKTVMVRYYVRLGQYTNSIRREVYYPATSNIDYSNATVVHTLWYTKV
ncbi:MAG: hypothetical protein LBB08_02070 [Rickettsiales bacterium]|jgi:hypothetical protein|nr:hypothetical protein [Rickettsiales bacterium]